MDKSDPEEDGGPWQLGPEIASILAPSLPGLADQVVDAVSVGVPAYAGSLTGAYGHNIRRGVDQGLRGFLELLQAGDQARLPGREVYEALGAGELREGRSLDALLAAYRAGARAAWRGLAGAGQRAALPPAQMYRLAEAVFAYIDELSAASAEGYAREQLNRAGEREARRTRLFELIVRDPPAPSTALEHAAEAAGWSLPARVAALVSTRPWRRLEAALPADSLLATHAGHRVALLTDPDAPGLTSALRRAARSGEEPSALGPSVDIAEVGRSLRWAEQALELGGGDAGLVVAEEHLLDLLVSSDRELLDALGTRCLAPLADQTPASHARLTRTLAVWLEHQGDARATAAALDVHVQTVRYRLGRLRDLLGPQLSSAHGRLGLHIALLWAAGHQSPTGSASPAS